MNIGILTGRGDCPGLDAVIRAVVRRALAFGIGTRFGLRAVDLVREGRFGQMVLHGTRVDAVPLGEATAGPKQMDLEQFADAEVFFG
jgi:6-phosphofructokinase